MSQATNDPNPIDDDLLRSYLAETLPPGDMSRIERALRDSAELRQRLEDVRQNKADSNLHTLGAIWRRNRLTCPNRQQLGSLLLDALDPDLAEYIQFHIEVVECPYCQANLADLRSKAEQATPAIQARHSRFLQSSRHLLSQDRDD